MPPSDVIIGDTDYLETILRVAHTDSAFSIVICSPESNPPSQPCGRRGFLAFFVIHFAMQLDGVQIDPKEWWGNHWIKDHNAKRPRCGKLKLLPNVSMANHFILGGS